MKLLPYNYHIAHRDGQHRKRHKLVTAGGALYITDRLNLQEQQQSFRTSQTNAEQKMHGN
jgi:hypothetical protein